MDDKPIMGLVVWLFFCVGLLTIYTIPDNKTLACVGNIVGLAALIWILRLPRVRRQFSEPTLISLLLLFGLIALGVALALGLGQLARLL